MNPSSSIPICAFAALLAVTAAPGATSAARVKTANGTVAGTAGKSGIRIFRGIPFAAPPVGELRWKAPQPAENWEGVRQAVEFSPNCMQRPVFGDMELRSKGMSEGAHVRKPIRDGNVQFPVLLVSAQDGNDGALHGGVIVAEADGIHNLAGVLIVFGAESVDVAHATTHEEEDDGFGFRRTRQSRILHHLAFLRQERAEGRAHESGGGLKTKRRCSILPQGERLRRSLMLHRT